MLQKLTETDLEKLKSTKNVFKVMHLLFLSFAFLISLLSGMFGIRIFGYLPTVGFTFLFLLLIYLIYFLTLYLKYRKDVYQQQKISATIQVIRKSPNKDKVIWTDNPVFKRIEVLNQEALSLINVGDKLYVEQTLNSKMLLRLEKQGKDLLNGGEQRLA